MIRLLDCRNPGHVIIRARESRKNYSAKKLAERGIGSRREAGLIKFRSISRIITSDPEEACVVRRTFEQAAENLSDAGADGAKYRCGADLATAAVAGTQAADEIVAVAGAGGGNSRVTKVNVIKGYRLPTTGKR